MGGGVCAACLLEEALRAAEGFAEPASSHALAEDAPLAQRFGPYELLEEVGRGGMGVIYKARHPGLDRVVALKMLLAGEFADAKTRERLLREARIAARLAHPGIVTIHDVGEHQGRPYFAMEYVPGRNLAQHCRDGLLPVAKAARHVEQLARAVHYAHQHGVIHRDLKPANVLISPDDEPKLTDFGLTKSLVDPTQTIESAGSPNFMAPEQADSALGATGTPTDVFGLGAILYYLLTGRPPAVGESLSETLRAVVACEPAAPRQVRPALPRDLETIALKCLEKEPGRRYGSALEVAEELGRWQRHEPIAARPSTAAGRLGKWARRHPAVAALSGAFGMALLLGFVGVTWQWKKAEQARAQSEISAYHAKLAASMSTKFEPAVRGELLAFPTHLRGWEWGHLLARCLPELLHARVSSSNLGGVAVSADNRRVACWDDGHVHMLDARANKKLASSRFSGGRVKEARFTPDGRLLLIRSDNGSVHILPPADGAGFGRLLPEGMARGSLEFTADSRQLVATGVDGIVRLFEISEGRLIREFQAGELRFATAHAATDGSAIIGISEAGGQPAFVRWALETGERLAGPPDLAKPAVQTAVSRKGDIYAQLLDPHRIEVRETLTGKLLATWAEPSRDLLEMELVRDGTRLLIRCSDGRALLLDATNGGLVAALSGVTRQFATQPGSEVALSLDTELGFRGWNLETGEESGLFPLHPGNGVSAALSPDGVLSAGTVGGAVWVWLSDVGRRGVSKALSGKVVSLAHSPDSTRFASAGADGRLQVWDARSSRRIPTVPDSASTPLTAVDWSRDGRWLATADADGFLCVRSAATGKVERRWSAFDGPIDSIATDAGSKWLAASGPGAVGLWELATGKRRWLASLDSAGGCVAFEPDGDGLYVSSLSGEVWAASLSTGGKLRSIALPPARQKALAACGPNTTKGRQLAVAVGLWEVELLDAHTLRSLGRVTPTGIGVLHLAYNPDGSRLAIALGVAGEDLEPSRLAIWDPWTRQPTLSLHEPGLRLKAASFSPDGLQLIAAGARGGIRVWDALPWTGSSAQLKAGAQEIPGIGRGLTDTELNRLHWLSRLEALDQRK